MTTPIAQGTNPARVIAFSNQKGGVGKTTTVVNLGYALAKLGRRVLMVDLDPQCNLTSAMGIEMNIGALGSIDLDKPETYLIGDGDSDVPTIFEVMFDGLPLSSTIQMVGGVGVVPCKLRMAGAEKRLNYMESGSDVVLRYALEEEVQSGRWDYVLVDCPPNMGSITVNALVAATEVIIPVQAQLFAILGVKRLLELVHLIKTKGSNRNLAIAGMLITMHDPRQKVCRKAEEVLRGNVVGGRYGGIFKTVIRVNVAIQQAAANRQPISDFDAKSFGASDYAALAAEIDQPTIA
jgi:chromosome partitioning protein